MIERSAESISVAGFADSSWARKLRSCIRSGMHFAHWCGAAAARRSVAEEIQLKQHAVGLRHKDLAQLHVERPQIDFPELEPEIAQARADADVREVGAASILAKTARDEGFSELAEWFETLAKAERSHANRFTKGLDSLKQ